MKRNNTVLGLSIAAIFAITVIAISAVPDALAKPSGNGQPDLIANLIAEGTNDAKGKAMFWFNDDKTELRYKIVLNKVDVGSVDYDDPEEKGIDKNSGKGLAQFVTKLHIHAAPGGDHTGTHLLNVVGPADDDDLKIAGHTFSGIWDDGDMTHGHGHNTKTLTSQVEALCNGDTDVNVHLNEDGGFIRGIITANSDTC